MKISVLLFGILKDLAGRSAQTLDLAENARARDVLLHYARTSPIFEAMVPTLAISVNQEYSRPDRLLHEGDEVGLLPPVSGGSGASPLSRVGTPDLVSSSADDIRITCNPIDAEAVVMRLKHASDGAVVIFDGIVRDNTRGRRTLYLDYEAYDEMALKQMEGLVAEAKTRFKVRRVSIVHRLGRLQIGESSVFIAVASAHRAAAFDASRWLIDTLKKTIPIWKKEYFEDGAMWADGEPFPEEIQSPRDTTGESPASK